MKKGLTNHCSGCIMQDVKGNGVFEQTLKDAIFCAHKQSQKGRSSEAVLARAKEGQPL